MKQEIRIKKAPLGLLHDHAFPALDLVVPIAGQSGGHLRSRVLQAEPFAVRAAADRDPWIVFLWADDALADLHGDPRFEKLVARVGGRD